MGYFSIGEYASDANYVNRIEELKLNALGKNDNWNSYITDLTDSRWRTFILDELVGKVAEKGFDGFFIDTMESGELLIDKMPDKVDDWFDGLVRVIIEIRKRYPRKQIIVNRGFRALDELKDTIDGVLLESLYQTHDYQSGEYHAVDSGTTAINVNRLKRLKSLGLDVFISDFCNAKDQVIIDETIEKIEALGFHPLVCHPDLMGKSLAPIKKMARKIMVLYGMYLDEGYRHFPMDTKTHQIAHTALEWLGYELEYVNVLVEEVPAVLSSDFAGVIIDTEINFEQSHLQYYFDWVKTHKARGIKFIFFDKFPFGETAFEDDFFKVFEIQSTDLEEKKIGKLSISLKDETVMGAEAPIKDAPGFQGIKSPADSKVFLKVNSASGDVYHPTFTCDWGGVALEPYLTFERPDKSTLLRIKIFEFLQKALAIDSNTPKPDVTTFQGLRIFHSQIDGDGFLHKSVVEKDKRSGEIILDDVLGKFPYPVTCSVISGEIKGDVLVYEKEDSEFLINTAKRLFLPDYVEAASHSYTHPFYWDDLDVHQKTYPARGLEMTAGMVQTKVDLDLEINKSVEFINDKLLPKGKQVELFLWSGNCRPSPTALAITADELKIPAMNGGMTTMSRRYPFLSYVGPKGISWGGRFQVFAPVQNENNYNNDFGNNQFGGFINVIQTFEMTESPRRLKPIDLYYHFYSADRYDSLYSLKKIYEWVDRQDIHPLWSSEYARMVESSHLTSIYKLKKSHWRIINNGKNQTFRIGNGNTYPDLEKSKGIIGYRVHQGECYVFSDGREIVDLVLLGQPSTVPYLHSSNVRLSNARFSKDGFSFSFKNLSHRNAEVVIGGCSDLKQLSVFIMGKQHLIKPDSKGAVLIKLNEKQGKVTYSKED